MLSTRQQSEWKKWMKGKTLFHRFTWRKWKFELPFLFAKPLENPIMQLFG